MKNWNKKLLCAMLIATLIMGVALAAGVVKTQQIEANYMGIKIVVDGVQITPTDATGREVEPFTCDGTTYLPVRAVANALGKDVDWEGETKTVYIGKIPGKEINWFQEVPCYQTNNATVYDGTDHTQSFTVAGKTQAVGVVLRTFHRSWKTQTAEAIWNTNCQYKTMNFSVGYAGSSEVDTELEVYLDGVYSKTYDLPWAAGVKQLSIPLNYSPNVMLKLVPKDKDLMADNVKDFELMQGIYDISFAEE